MKSNQRITKIKRDPIEELLKKAETTSVENATDIQEVGSDLTPYPDMTNLRIWTRDYLLKGLNLIYNNNITETGDTNFTTIIDGLVLNTKQTKSIGQIPSIERDFPAPCLTSNGTLGGDSFACAYGGAERRSDYGDCYALTYDSAHSIFSFKISPKQSTDGTIPYIIYYNPGPIKLQSVSISDRYINDKRFFIRKLKVYGSNDNSDWIFLADLNYPERKVGEFREVTAEVNASLSFKYFRFDFIDWQFKINAPESTSTSYTPMLSMLRLNGTYLAPGDVVTSKPGLWLSNLCTPYYQSSSGGYLRQNNIGSNRDYFDSLNNDTIGNYAYSFIQRGIIYRKAGSTHDSKDSYLQHWSPSILGNMSFESLVIDKSKQLEPIFQDMYTNYQTLAVPNNPDLNIYQETDSKELEYNFIDNSNGAATTTTYYGKFVGTDWSYELEFSQNNIGSGTTYVDTNPCETGYNCSSGGCVTGTINYILPNGETCSQNIDECFTTDKALFNPNNPNNKPTGEPLSDSTTKITIVEATHTLSSGVIPGRCYGNGCYVDQYTGLTCGRCNKINGGAAMYGVVSAVITSVTDANCDTFDVDLYGIPQGETTKQNLGKSASNFTLEIPTIGAGTAAPYWTIETSSGCPSYLPSFHGRSITRFYENIVEEQTGVNIYYNIKDLKAEYTANGLPWDYDCDVNRFETWFSYEPCNDTGCTSILVAENVNINQLGDISQLVDKKL